MAKQQYLITLLLILSVTLGVSAADIKHRFVATDESGKQLLYVDEINPANDWTVPLQGNRDLQLSQNGTVLVSIPSGYREYDLKNGKLIKEVKVGKGVQSLVRLNNGHTFLASKQGVIELDKDDKQVAEQKIEMGGYFRLLRLTKSGNYLYTSGKTSVRELQPDAATLRELNLTTLTTESHKPYFMEEMSDGRFLVSTGYGGTVLIVDKQWKLVKTYGGKGKVPGIKTHFFADAQRLKNGNIVVANWTGHKRNDSQKAPQAIEFDQNGKVVWSWHNPKRAGALHGIEVIDSGLSMANTYQEQVQQGWIRTLPKKMNPEIDAFGAVNGNRHENHPGFHTKPGETGWWKVDLQKPIEGKEIRIFNRASFQKRAKNISVLCSLDGDNWTLLYQHDKTLFEGGVKNTKPLSIPLSGQKFQYIKVENPNEILHLSEVEVYGRKGLDVNIALNKPATQSSISDWSTRSLDVVGVSETSITDAFGLLEKTVELVAKDNKKVDPAFLAAKEKLEKEWRSGIAEEKHEPFFFKVRWLRRKILFSDKHLDFDKIMINRNPPTMYSHNGDQHLGMQSREGPGLALLTNWKTEPKLDSFLDGKLPKGATRNPNLHYDADRVVFAFCDYSFFDKPHPNRGKPITNPAKDPNRLERRYFIYEAALDGSWVRQITGTKDDPFETPNNRRTAIIEDNDPCYLPDGDIMFISTRIQCYGRCHGTRYNPAWVLYRCKSDGTGIRQLSYGNENEVEPVVLNDGRIVFTRWEYTNRHEMFFHMLWQCRPDGTGVANFFGNDMLHPMMITEANPIPGTHKVVATAMGHHQYSTGTMIVMDTNKGENGEECITHITPEVPYPETKGWPDIHYSHPHPLSEHLFLASRADHTLPMQNKDVPPNGRAIYLVDDLGGREFIYEDPNVASFSPIPVIKRARPPVVPSTLPENAPDEGTLFVQDINLTRNDPEGKLKRGDIKYLRINALHYKPQRAHHGANPYVYVEIPKRVIGTVPVNEDGSVMFKAPARTSLQMQALDKDGRAILTEKSFFYLQPGENRSCVGCHESSGSAPNPTAMSKLLKKGAAKMRPPAGPQYPGGMSFMRTVQPVLDRYCISCHGLNKTEGDVSLLSTKNHFADKKTMINEFKKTQDGKFWKRPDVHRFLNPFFRDLNNAPNSYVEITKRGKFLLGFKMMMYKDEGNISYAYEPYYARGCSVSDMILKHHGKVNMDEESRLRIFEWMDLNAQLNADTFPVNNNREDRKYDPAGMVALRAEIKKQLGAKWARLPNEALVNVVEPEESRVLMAPLAEKAGGWGQLKKWNSKNDRRFRKMHTLVMTSFVRPKNEVEDSWKPLPEQGAWDPDIAADQKAFESKTGKSPLH